MKLAIGGIHQETNCFSYVPTRREDWTIYEGNALLEKERTKTYLGGALDMAREKGWEILPTIWADDMPAAPTPFEVYQDLKNRIVEAIRVGNPDAVVLLVHGAMMAQGVDDPECDLVCAVRKVIGNKPLTIVEDLHANNSAKTVLSVDGVFGLKTNPHTDHYERARDAVECIDKMYKGEWCPVTAFAHPPVAFPTINMLTAKEPMKELMDMAYEWEQKPGMINVTVSGGFPFVDAEYTGFSVSATANGDQSLAQAACDAIAKRAWEKKDQFLKKMTPIDEAIKQAKEHLESNPKYPVILADVADNPGGGGSGDTTLLMEAVLKENIPGTAIGYIWDLDVIKQAFEVGVGNTATFTIGGKHGIDYGKPLVIEATVCTLSDGTFYATGPMGRNNLWHYGPCCRLKTGNCNIILYTKRDACNEADFFRHLGLEPANQRLLLIKSRGHFRAAFEPIASRIIEVDAPGAATPNLEHYHYKKLNVWPINREKVCTT